MQQIFESPNAMAARCMDTSSRLREFLYYGHELAWDVRRDIATLAIQLLDLSAKLEDGQEKSDEPVPAMADRRQTLTPKVA